MGANTWIWTAPLTDEAVRQLVPRVAAFGFDLVEFPLEEPGSFNYAEAGRFAHAHGLATSMAAVIGLDRDLIHPDVDIHPDMDVRGQGMAYVRQAIARSRIRRDQPARPILFRCRAHMDRQRGRTGTRGAGLSVRSDARLTGSARRNIMARRNIIL